MSLTIEQDTWNSNGWLIGDWVMDATVHKDDGTAFKGSGEIHFGWVLQGRAIQDVWILPGVFHGTTLRIYDPGSCRACCPDSQQAQLGEGSRPAPSPIPFC